MGAPRIGNKHFSDWADLMIPNKHFRIVNQNDPTPHLPPMNIGYMHSGREIWIQKTDDHQDEPFVTFDCGSSDNESIGEESKECANSINFGWNEKHS